MNMKYNDTTQAIIDRLDENNIDYGVFEHESVTTCGLIGYTVKNITKRKQIDTISVYV